MASTECSWLRKRLCTDCMKAFKPLRQSLSPSQSCSNTPNFSPLLLTGYSIPSASVQMCVFHCVCVSVLSEGCAKPSLTNQAEPKAQGSPNPEVELDSHTQSPIQHPGQHILSVLEWPDARKTQCRSLQDLIHWLTF